MPSISKQFFESEPIFNVTTAGKGNEDLKIDSTVKRFVENIIVFNSKYNRAGKDMDKDIFANMSSLENIDDF